MRQAMPFELPQALDYVQAAAGLAGLALAPAQAQAVATHLQRTAALARQLEQHRLAPEAEPAELFRAAPYPMGAPS